MTFSWNKLIYNSGDVFLPEQVREILLKGIYFDNTKTLYINGWTFVHFISGILCGYLYLYLNKPIENYYFKLFIIHTIWELWQMLIGMSKPWKLTGNSNLLDTIVDTLVFMFGGYIIKLLIKK